MIVEPSLKTSHVMKKPSPLQCAAGGVCCLSFGCSFLMFTFFLPVFFSAPGGFIVEDTDHTKPSRTDVCVFSCEATPEKIGGFYDVSRSFSVQGKWNEKEYRFNLSLPGKFQATHHHFWTVTVRLYFLLQIWPLCFIDGSTLSLNTNLECMLFQSMFQTCIIQPLCALAN